MALSIGLVLDMLMGKKQNYLQSQPLVSCGCDHLHHRPEGLWGKTKLTFYHACDEFFDMGKFLIIGALLAAVMQTLISRSLLLSIGQGRVSSVLVMMGLAYGLSLCSEADAFVASTFFATFMPASLLAFLIYGPMIDVKNTLMLLGSFRTRFVVFLIALITLFIFGLHIFLPGWSWHELLVPGTTAKSLPGLDEML